MVQPWSLEFAGCRLLVRSSDPTALLWLREFAGPTFSEARDGFHHHEVVLREDTAEFASLHALGPHPTGRVVDCFSLDTKMISHRLWNGPHDERVLFDATTETFYRRRNGPDRSSGAISPLTTTEIVCSRATRAVRVALLRIVREIGSAHVAERGGLIVHGAAFGANGGAYVIAGPKNAGKTTLLMHVLAAGGTSYISNDRVVLTMQPGAMAVHGIPTIVSIRASSLAMLTAVAAKFHKNEYHHSLTMDEAMQANGTATEQSSPGLSPAQFCSVLGVDRSGHAPLAALIFPKRTGVSGGLNLEPLSAGLASERLRASLFRADSGEQVAEFFSERRLGVSRDRMCDEIAARIPGFDCSLGSEAYEDRASAAALLAGCNMLTPAE